MDEGGNCYFIEGIRAIYPRNIVAMAPIRPDSSGYWKKIARLRRASRNVGKKIVKREFPGYL